MKRIFSLLLVLAFAFSVTASFAQEAVSTTAEASAFVSHPVNATIHIGINRVRIEARHADGTLFAVRETHNLVTNGGFTYIENQLSGTAVAVANYIALAADSSNSGAGTVAATDTTIASSGTGSTEINNTNGLGRAAGTFTADSPGAKQYTIVKVFSVNPGTQAGINKTAVFNASSSGTMLYEALFTAVSVGSGDTLTVTWTVTLS